MRIKCGIEGKDRTTFGLEKKADCTDDFFLAEETKAYFQA